LKLKTFYFWHWVFTWSPDKNKVTSRMTASWATANLAKNEHLTQKRLNSDINEVSNNIRYT